MAVAFQDVSKIFAGGMVALDSLNISFDMGEFVVLLGPSGSGKTTACRILAGLEQPSSGQILVDEQDITQVPPRERGMSMVFQNYALYAHKSVYENIAYPLRIRKMPRARIDSTVREMAHMLQIDSHLDRRPRQLSGGEAQRVAVARALVWQPRLCLMDEPLSNLDALLRLRTRTELKRLHNELGNTFVFVTHDQEEALTLGTRIAVLHHGRLVQFDTPRQIYHRPATRFVAEFIGRPAMNTIDGEVSHGVFRAGAFELPVPERPDGPVVLGIRPENVALRACPDEDVVACTVDVVEIVEPDVLVFVKSGDVSLIARMQSEITPPSRGETVHLGLPVAQRQFFDLSSGARLP